MPKFNVLISRTVYETTTVEVEADGEREAKHVASLIDLAQLKGTHYAPNSPTFSVGTGDREEDYWPEIDPADVFEARLKTTHHSERKEVQ